MCEPTEKQISRLLYLVNARFPDALPDRFESLELAGRVQRVNHRSEDFRSWLVENITLHDASRVINFFNKDEDDRAMKTLKNIYPRLNY